MCGKSAGIAVGQYYQAGSARDGQLCAFCSAAGTDAATAADDQRNHAHRKTELGFTGRVAGRSAIDSRGDAAWWLRGELRAVEKDSDRIKPVERVMSHSIGSFQITHATIEQSARLRCAVSVPVVLCCGLCQASRQSAFGAPACDRRGNQWIAGDKRATKYPVEFPGPRHDNDTFEITLPAGYQVDELPAPTDVEYAFGSYHSKPPQKATCCGTHDRWKLKS
jgi:hypothetical protein